MLGYLTQLERKTSNTVEAKLDNHYTSLMPTDHVPAPTDLEFARTAHEERHLLETVEVPVVTVSATFKEEVEKEFGEQPKDEMPDVTFSRAHYSMANAIVVAAGNMRKSFWMIDPTNYVSAAAWPKVLFTEEMGRIIARNPLLKELKDMMDTRVRNQLPLTAAIREPLSYVTGRTRAPIISLHYEAGNILVENGKTVLQVVTDPHVRPQYVTNADSPHMSYAVFDEKTKAELLELAYILGHKLDESRVTVVGCPVDPRLEAIAKRRSTTAFRDRPLRLAVTTGGLGTNKGEIEELLHHLAPSIKNGHVAVAAYAGVHDDFLHMFTKFAREHDISRGHEDNVHAPFRIFKGTDIVDANELLLKHVFPWADGFVTKPSGDMAYEAVAAGCFLLTLTPWGPWEENIRAHFEEAGVSVRARGRDIVPQITALSYIPVKEKKSWVELAMERAKIAAPHLARGAENIVRLQQKMAKTLR